MRIAIFGKNLTPGNGEYIKQLLEELSNRQLRITVYEPFARMLEAFVPKSIGYEVFSSHSDHNADLMFSIGGDGTILDTVPFVLDSGMPVVGINMGRLGFLSSIP